MTRDFRMRIIEVVQKETPPPKLALRGLKPWPWFLSFFDNKLMQVKSTHPAREMLADAVSNLLFFADTKSSFTYTEKDLVEMCGRLLNCYFKDFPLPLLVEGILGMAEIPFESAKNNSVVWVLRHSLSKLSGEEDPLTVWNRALSRHRNNLPQMLEGSKIPDIIWKLTREIKEKSV